MRYAVVSEDYFKHLVSTDLDSAYILEQSIANVLKTKITDYGRKLKNVITNHVDVAINHVNGLPRDILTSTDMTERLDADGNAIVQNAMPDVSDMLTDYYEKGKKIGFDEINRETFRGFSDVHSLRFVTNYNFDLIQKLSYDVRLQIRHEIWKGIEQGKSISQVTQALKRVPIEPLDVINKATGKRLYTLSPNQRAKLISHTEMDRAINQGRLMSYQMYDIDKIDIFNTGKNICGPCIADADGSPYPVESVPVKPSHPGCKCYYKAAVEASKLPQDPDKFKDLTTGDVISVIRY